MQDEYMYVVSVLPKQYTLFFSSLFDNFIVFTLLSRGTVQLFSRSLLLYTLNALSMKNDVFSALCLLFVLSFVLLSRIVL